MKSYAEFLYPKVFMGDRCIIGPSRPGKVDMGGWYLGSGLISPVPDRKDFWVNIPKNASNSMSQFLLNRGWQDANFILNGNVHQRTHKHIILRAPLERFKSAILETAMGGPRRNFYGWFKQNITPYFESLPITDVHFVRQADFIINIPWDTATFYYCDKDLSKNILMAFDDAGPFPILNEGVTKKRKQEAKVWLEEMLTDPIRERIMEFYALDYELIQKAIPIAPVVVTNDIIALPTEAITKKDTDTDTT